MFTTRINNKYKLLLILFFVFFDLQILFASGDVVPKVSSKPILFDSFVFTSLGGHINLSQYFLSGYHDFNSISSVSGIAVGIHTKDERLYTQLGLGYQYMPYAFAGQLISNPINTHWVNVDLNQQFLLKSGVFLVYGIQSSIRVKRELNFPLADQYAGISNDCFNNVTVALYAGYVIPIQPNFILQLRMGGYILSPINDIVMMRNMSESQAKSDKIFFEARLVYRIFTTGKKSKYLYPLAIYPRWRN